MPSRESKGRIRHRAETDRDRGVIGAEGVELDFKVDSFRRWAVPCRGLRRGEGGGGEVERERGDERDVGLVCRRAGAVVAWGHGEEVADVGGWLREGERARGDESEGLREERYGRGERVRHAELLPVVCVGGSGVQSRGVSVG